jgi:hypothetical protein
MIAGIFVLLALAMSIGIGLIVWRDMKSEEKISTVKFIGFTMVCLLLAMVFLSFVVILF